MQKSEQINELAKALCAAQQEMRHAIKDAKNPFFKSDYATLAAISDACLPALNKNGIAVTQTTTHSDNLHTALHTTLMHVSGQWISSEYPVNPGKPDPQSLGSALSYARRYSLAGIAGVVVGDDDGEAAMNRDAAEKPKSEKLQGVNSANATKPTDAQIEQLKAAIKKSTWGDDDVLTYLDRMGMKKLKELNWFQFLKMLEMVEKFPKQKEAHHPA